MNKDKTLLESKAIFDLKKFGYIDPSQVRGFVPNSEIEEYERAVAIWIRGYMAACEQMPTCVREAMAEAGKWQYVVPVTLSGRSKPDKEASGK